MHILCHHSMMVLKICSKQSVGTESKWSEDQELVCLLGREIGEQEDMVKTAFSLSMNKLAH